TPGVHHQPPDHRRGPARSRLPGLRTGRVARLLGQFIASDVLDELCLTMSPMLTAGGAQRISGGPGVTVPRRFELVSLLEEAGFLFSRYRRS
ncbi:pyrimidine reductase family protein, partial [Streptomyces sp. NPDC048279]